MNSTGTLTFLAHDSEAPVYRASVGGAEARLDLAGTYEKHDVPILDGRLLDEKITLDVTGFQLAAHRSATQNIYDEKERALVHDRECCDLVLAATSASHAHVFDHTLRSGDAQRRDETKSREPTAVIHNDYTVKSGPQRVRDLMGAKAEDLLTRRFAIVNVWRPIRPVKSFPLALCDARSVNPTSLVPSERRAKDRIGEIYMARFDAGQRWIYFPNMAVDEALLIKTFDSIEDGRARWAIHTAFADPNSSPDAPARESIETRVFAFF